MDVSKFIIHAQMKLNWIMQKRVESLCSITCQVIVYNIVIVEHWVEMVMLQTYITFIFKHHISSLIAQHFPI